MNSKAILNENFSFKELIVISLFCVICFFIFSIRSGGIISWDELYYAYLAGSLELNRAAVNRYLHVYILKFFLIFFEPLVAVRVFWSMIVSSSVFFIYISTKFMFEKKIMAIMSVIIFFTMGLIFIDYSGVPYSEFSVMYFILFHFLFFTFYFRQIITKNTFLMLTGIFLVLALRSKEIGICVGYWFILGLIDFEKEKLNFDKKVLSNVGVSLLGIFIGLSAMSLLDGLFLNKYFLFFDPDTWKELLGFNVRLTGANNDFTTVNFFMEFLNSFNKASVPFLLFLLSFSSVDSFDNKLKFCWPYVFVFMTFLLFFYSTSGFSLIVRYSIVVYPLIAILGSSVFFSNKKYTINDYLKITLLAIVFFSISVILNYLGRDWNGKESYFFYCFVSTLSMMAVVISFLFKQNIKTYILIASFFLGTGKIIYDTEQNYQKMISRNFSLSRFAPLDKFSSEIREYLIKIDKKSTVVLYCSETFYKKRRIFARNKGSCKWMFSVSFDIFDQNMVAQSQVESESDLFKKFNIIIWEKSDYLSVLSTPEYAEILERKFNVFIKDDYFVLALRK